MFLVWSSYYSWLVNFSILDKKFAILAKILVNLEV